MRIFFLFISLLLANSAMADPTVRCPRDELLDRAAARLLENREPRAAENLTAQVRASGSDAVGVRALWLPGRQLAQEQIKLEQWLRAFQERADAPLVCGEASGSDGRMVIAFARGGTLQPLYEHSRDVRGWLAPGFERPELVISDNEGRMLRYRVDRARLQKGIALRSDLHHPVVVQLVASGKSGPRPVAERVIPFKSVVSPPIPLLQTAQQAAPRRDTSASELTFQLNRIRKQRGAPPVRENRLLAAVAEEHARAVCDSGRVAHELQPGRDPETRLALAGLSARMVGETVARSNDAVSALDAMKQSPSHLMTLLERRFTDAGVGLALNQEGQSCAVVLLAAWPRYVGR